ncbi:hypothetical protein K9M41_01540 [Candidatus Gracilibacteria bacterium]|nr:hypothetical protein [Candidatus Gracilibacteria bacterium]
MKLSDCQSCPGCGNSNAVCSDLWEVMVHKNIVEKQQSSSTGTGELSVSQLKEKINSGIKRITEKTSVTNRI